MVLSLVGPNRLLVMVLSSAELKLMEHLLMALHSVTVKLMVH
jgi:hypothetical protein